MRYEYTVTATNRGNGRKLSLDCFGANKQEAIDHAQHHFTYVVESAPVLSKKWKFEAVRTGKRAF